MTFFGIMMRRVVVAIVIISTSLYVTGQSYLLFKRYAYNRKFGIYEG